MTSAFLLSDLKRDEGLRLTAYPDPLSGGVPWTIGYGATGPHIGPGTVWTIAQADADLAARVETITLQLSTTFKWFAALADARQDVLVNMAYNLGFAGLLKFKSTLAAVAGGEWQTAAADMLASLWARQVPSRAKRLAQQMLTGINAYGGQPMTDPFVIQPAVPPVVPTPPVPLTPSVPQLAPIFVPAPVVPPKPTVVEAVTSMSPAQVGIGVAATGLAGGVTAMSTAHAASLKDIIDLAFIYLVTPIVMGIVVGLAASLARLLHINMQSALAQRVLTAAENGAAALVSKAQTAADDHAVVMTKSAQVAGTLNYLNTAVPDAVKALGLATPTGQMQLANLAEAKVAQAATAAGVPLQ